MIIGLLNDELFQKNKIEYYANTYVECAYQFNQAPILSVLFFYLKKKTMVFSLQRRNSRLNSFYSIVKNVKWRTKENRWKKKKKFICHICFERSNWVELVIYQMLIQYNVKQSVGCHVTVWRQWKIFDFILFQSYFLSHYFANIP